MPILSQFEDYLTLEKKYSRHTVLAYKKDIASFSTFCTQVFETSNLTEVNYSIIRSWIVSLVDKGISNRTINRKISSLKTFYKYLLKIGEIEETPLAGHKALKTPKKIQIPFSETEVEDVLLLLETPTDFVSARDKLMVELFYATGMRRAELIQLKLNDISISQKTVKVLGKRNKERIIPLLASVLNTLATYLHYRDEIKESNSTPYLFLTQKGVQVYETLVYRVINLYFSKASQKVKRSPHIIRHSFATHLLNQGADLNALKELLGHSSLAATQVYTHNSIDQLKEVYRKTHPRNK